MQINAIPKLTVGFDSPHPIQAKGPGQTRCATGAFTYAAQSSRSACPADPTELIRRVRAIEAADPTCARWPRNKTSDDATAAYTA